MKLTTKSEGKDVILYKCDLCRKEETLSSRLATLTIRTPNETTLYDICEGCRIEFENHHTTGRVIRPVINQPMKKVFKK